MNRPSARQTLRPTALFAIAVPLLLLSAVPSATGSAPGGRVSAPPCGYSVNLSAQPSGGPAPLLVRFSASVSAGTPSYDAWDFGDGTVWNASGSGASDPLHRYTVVGTYTVVVTVDVSGCVEGASTTVVVTAGPLEATISARPSGGDAPLTVVFNASISGGTGTFVSVVWQFGDGGEGSGPTVAYTYEGPGRFLVLVNVTDSQGDWAIASTAVNVSAGAGPPTDSLGTTFLPPERVLLSGGAALGLVFAVVLLVSRRRGTYPREPQPRGPAEGVGGEPGTGDARPPTSTLLGDGVGPVPGGSASPSVASPGPLRPPGPEPTASVPPPPSPARRPTRESVGLTQKVILHIGRQGRLPPEVIAPIELTQRGIAAATGARQNTLTNVLRRLVAAGILRQELRHVRGQDRRLRVYYFSPRGESVFEELRRRVAEPGRSGQGTGPDAPDKSSKRG